MEQLIEHLAQENKLAKRQFLVIPLHSAVDVITNSSTELFICNTAKTKAEIESLLNSLAEVLEIEHGVGKIEVGSGVSGLKKALKFCDGYEEYYGCLHSILWKFIEYDDQKGQDLLKSIPKSVDIWNACRHLKDKERHEAMDSLRNKQTQAVQDFLKDNEETLNNYVTNIVIVRGESDNSIPYELFDIIEHKLNACRFHLG